MVVLARKLTDMQRDLSVDGKGSEELVDRLSGQPSQAVTLEGEIRVQAPVAEKVHGGFDQGILAWYDNAAEADDSVIGIKGLGDGAAQNQADIDDRVMIVDFEITLGDHTDVEVAVEAHLSEHVIEEVDPGRDVATRSAIEVQHDLDASRSGLPFYFGVSHARRRFAHGLSDYTFGSAERFSQDCCSIPI